MKNLVFLGPPGVGKGTMAAMLTERDHCLHISTGDILRAEMKSDSDLGKLARQYVDSGRLVPDELVAAIVTARLAERNTRSAGFILDGFPRTVPQAKLLEEALQAESMSLDAVVLFEAERDLLLKRLTARRLCRDCGAVYNIMFNPPTQEGVCDKCTGLLLQRSDDSMATAVDRLEVYEQQTAPLVKYYQDRDLLVRVSGAGEKEENFASLLGALGS